MTLTWTDTGFTTEVPSQDQLDAFSELFLEERSSFGQEVESPPPSLFLLSPLLRRADDFSSCDFCLESLTFFFPDLASFFRPPFMKALLGLRDFKKSRFPIFLLLGDLFFEIRRELATGDLPFFVGGASFAEDFTVQILDPSTSRGLPMTTTGEQLILAS